MIRPILLALVAFPTLAHAHYLWATLDPGAKTVAVALQEIPSDEPIPLAARAPKVKAWAKAPLVLKADGSWLKAPAEDDGVAVSLDYGVLDKRDQGRGLFWLNYYAKAAATPEASQKRLDLPVELTVARGVDGRPVVTVLEDGKPAAEADVIVENPVGTNTFEGKTGPDGTVAIPATDGPIAVRALVAKDGKGTHDGAAYDLVRSYSTLTVGAPKKEVPFNRLISASFGNNHEIVSKTAFIQTVMDGKLTKPQLERHLQQRALVHDAVHRVLVAADPKKAVPYGDEQKNVLVLLFGDLLAMGSDWPTPAQSTPLTKAFVQEIADSARTGPYFALGVMHVYYGGITNGGRDIGAMIADEVKVPQNYYLKSDGYRDYVKRVNEIVDPADRAEMIRGGGAAYRYIIAANDDPLFKAAP